MQNIYRLSTKEDGHIGYYSSIAKVTKEIESRSITADSRLRQLKRDAKTDRIVWYKTFMQRSADAPSSIRDLEYVVEKLELE